MKRNSKNLKLYRQTCEKIYERCSGQCEVMVDKFGSIKTPTMRCQMVIPYERVRWSNYLHTETRNGKSDEWVLSPDNIIFGCEKHHIEEHTKGLKIVKHL